MPLTGRHQTLIEGVSHMRSARTGKWGPSVIAVMGRRARARSMHSCTPYRTPRPVAAGDAQGRAGLHLDTKMLRLQIARRVVQPSRQLSGRRTSADRRPCAAQLLDPARQLVRRRAQAWTGIARNPDRFDHWQLHVCICLPRLSASSATGPLRCAFFSAPGISGTSLTNLITMR